MRSLLLLGVVALVSVGCSAVDPFAPERPDTATEQALRQQAEALAASVQAGDLTACEAAARLYETAVAADDPADAIGWVAARSQVLAAVRPSLVGGSAGTEVQGFDDSGFRPEFRDGSNQVRHLAAAVQAGASLGTAARVVHRVLRPDSPQDTALNDVATGLGAALVSGALPPAAAGAWIRTAICDGGPGVG